MFSMLKNRFLIETPYRAPNRPPWGFVSFRVVDAMLKSPHFWVCYSRNPPTNAYKPNFVEGDASILDLEGLPDEFSILETGFDHSFELGRGEGA